MSEGNIERDISPLILAAHELKSPLALMRQLALSAADENISNSDKLRLLQQIVLTSERSLRLTSDLTKSARLDDGLFQLEPVNPEQLCRDVALELKEVFTAYGRSLTYQTRKHPLLLIANRDLLRRIVLNFSDNALHYTKDGTAVSIQIKALKKAGYIRIGVRDFGPSLSSDMWRRLKKQIDSKSLPINARPESSGLGLLICSKFAEVMNGKVGFIKHKNGATFYVDLQASMQTSLL